MRLDKENADGPGGEPAAASGSESAAASGTKHAAASGSKHAHTAGSHQPRPAVRQTLHLPEQREYVARLSHSDGDMSPSHWHDAMELIYLAQGELLVRLPDGERELAAGEFAVIGSGQIHSTCCLRGNDALLLILPDEFLARYTAQDGESVYVVPAQARHEEERAQMDAVSGVLGQMYLLLKTASQEAQGRAASPRAYPAASLGSGSSLKFHSYLFELLYLLHRDFRIPLTESGTGRQNRNFTVLRPLLAYMDEHYTETVSVSQAAAATGLQPNYFCRYFKKHTGYTLLEYQYTQRMAHIVEDLLTTADPISMILDRHGFTNYRLFRRLFRERFHLLPAEFRKQFAGKIE